MFILEVIFFWVELFDLSVVDIEEIEVFGEELVEYWFFLELVLFEEVFNLLFIVFFDLIVG